MAKKVLLKDANKNEILPITRGELVLDSSGKQALHSDEFLATTSQPGLMSKEDKYKIDNISISTLEITDLLPNGKKIATISVGSTSYNILAPASYDWDEINNKPTKLSQFTDDVVAGKYLPLSGGTIEGEFGALTIKRNNAYASAIRLENTSGVLGYIGFNDDYSARLWDKNQNDIGILIHSGNIGSNNAGSATKLATSRTIWGQSFDGTADVTGDMSGVGKFSANDNGYLTDISNGNINMSIPTKATGGWARGLTYKHLSNENSFGVVSGVLGAGSVLTYFFYGGAYNIGTHAMRLYDSTNNYKAIFTGNVTAPSFIGNIDGTYVNKLTGYTKATTISTIAESDSLNTALGKLELKADTTYELVKGAYDGDGTIENLAEILKVLEGISDTETIQAIVGKYLPLSGGTLTGPLKIESEYWGGQLNLNRPNNGDNWGPNIRFYADGTGLGAISMGNNELYVGDIAGNSRTAVSKVGHTHDYLPFKSLWVDSSSTAFDLNNAISLAKFSEISYAYAGSPYVSNQPWSSAAATVYTFPGTYPLQIAKFYNSNDIRVRGCYGGTWQKWKRLAFTSDIPTSLPANGGNADTVDGYHASSLWRSDGGTWNPNADIALNATANSQEWSFDITRNGKTGCYWHVWDSQLYTMLRVNADDGKVSAPYGFVGNLTGKASALTDLAAGDGASATATKRKVWFSYDDGVTGRPALSDQFTFQVSTSTLFVPHINGKITIPGGSYSWYQVQQYNSSNSNPSYYSSDCAIININSYTGWQPWIRGVDSENGSWTIGQYTTNLHIGYIPKTNTSNGLTYRWDFAKDGSTYFPGSVIVPTGLIWVQGGGSAGSNFNRLTTTSGMPTDMQYNTSKRGTQIYANGIAFCDPYNGKSNNDSGWIRHLETTANNGVLEIAMGDDAANEEIRFRYYNTSNNIAYDILVPRATGTLALTSQIPTNTWRPVTNTYTGSDQSTCVSQYGTNALYNALLNGYANSAGNADTLDGLHWTSFARWYGDANTDSTHQDVTSTSTADFFSKIHATSGLFNSRFGAMRGSWWYVGNTQLNTGVGTLEMAGTAVLNLGSYADTNDTYKSLLFLDQGGRLWSYTANETAVKQWSRYVKTTDKIANASWADGASTVTVHDSNSNSTYRMVWHSGNTLYGTGGIYCNPSTDYMYANSFNCGDWFRSSGNTGWYNPTNECHVYPNNISTYGGLILRGTKGSYHGFLLGTSNSYMNVMSTDTHHGLYCENTGQWEFYYNRSSKGAGILTSTLTKTINLAGTTYISGKTWIGGTEGNEMLNVNGWVGTVGNTGWYNSTYAGGIYMVDSMWVRIYNDKKFYVSNSSSNAIHSEGGVYVAGAVHAYANYLKSTYSGCTVTIGSQNSGWCHYETTAPAHWFNVPVYAAGGFFEYSDETLKDFHNDIQVDFEKLKTIPKKYFNFKSTPNKIEIGTSAQAVQKIYPEFVHKNADDTLGVDYGKLSVLALKGIDELYDMIMELRAENRQLREQIRQMQK